MIWQFPHLWSEKRKSSCLSLWIILQNNKSSHQLICQKSSWADWSFFKSRGRGIIGIFENNISKWWTQASWSDPWAKTRNVNLCVHEWYSTLFRSLLSFFALQPNRIHEIATRCWKWLHLHCVVKPWASLRSQTLSGEKASVWHWWGRERSFLGSQVHNSSISVLGTWDAICRPSMILLDPKLAIHADWGALGAPYFRPIYDSSWLKNSHSYRVGSWWHHTYDSSTSDSPWRKTSHSCRPEIIQAQYLDHLWLSEMQNFGPMNIYGLGL